MLQQDGASGARLVDQGVQPPAPGDYAVAEVAGFLMHASSIEDERVAQAAKVGHFYQAKTIAKGSKGLGGAVRYLRESDLPPPQQRRAKAAGARGPSLWQKAWEAASHVGRHPGLGKVVYGALGLAPPTMGLEEQPAPKRRKVAHGAGEEQPPREKGGDAEAKWRARFEGAVGSDVAILASAWDVHAARLAVAVAGTLHDADKEGADQQTVLIYDAKAEDFVMALRCPAHHDIRCLQFSQAPGVLAVGVRGGVVIWDLGSTCMETAKGAVVAAHAAGASSRVSSEQLAGVVSSYRALKTGADATSKLPPWGMIYGPGRSAVTSLCFSNVSGRYLIFGCEDSVSLCVADMGLPFDEATRKLQLVWTDSYGGARCVSFSPDDTLVAFTTPHRPVLVIYNTKTWEATECPVSAPLCNLTWHPMGHLLFNLQGGSDVYVLKLRGDGGAVKPTVVCCEQLGGYGTRGGAVTQMGVVMNLAVDPTGRRVAVALKDGLVAVYQVGASLQGALRLAPVGLARLHAGCPGGHFPVRLGFAHNVRKGAVLSALWGDGLLTFLPLRFE